MSELARRRVGRSNVEVSELGLGGAALGNLYAPVAEATAQGTVAAALEAGVRYFDTAPYYGYGLSERRFGEALAEVPRNDVVISTKVGRRLVARSTPPRSDQGFVDALPFDPEFDYGYDGVMRSFESSLERLRTDRIDVLLIHDIGALTHGEAEHARRIEQLEEGGARALMKLREEGTVGAIGAGVNECAVCEELLGRIELDGFLLAGRYTLLEQTALDRLLPLCQERGVSLIIGGPFNSGLLTGEPRPGATYDYAEAEPGVLERAHAIYRVCQEHGVALEAAALQFPLRHPAVASVIPGARSRAEATANAAHYRAPLPDSLWSDLIAHGLLRPDAPV